MKLVQRFLPLTLLLGAWLGTDLVMPVRVQAAESSQEDQVAPTTVEEILSSFERSFRLRRELGVLFPRLRQFLDETPQFFRDTKAYFHSRTFYFNRRRFDGSHARATATGGDFAYHSGKLYDVFSVHSSVHTSQRIHGDKDHDGTGLLKPGQHGYTVLAHLYGEAHYRNHILRGYKMDMHLPYVNEHDIRMTPNAFEAYTYTGYSNAIPWLEAVGEVDYITGYVREIKRRNDDEFISMSKAAGASGGNEGLFLGGFRIRPNKSTVAGIITHHVPNVIQITYAEGSYQFNPTEEVGLRFDLQFTDQRSVGDDRRTGESYNTQSYGARVATSYRDAVLTLAATTTGRDEEIINPFGSDPSFAGLMQSNFNRAGEDAVLAGLSYNFESVGLKDLSAFTNIAYGQDARDAATGASLGDRWEWNITMDYRISTGKLSGLWFRARHAYQDLDGADHTQKEWRVILNYTVRLL